MTEPVAVTVTVFRAAVTVLQLVLVTVSLGGLYTTEFIVTVTVAVLIGCRVVGRILVMVTVVGTTLFEQVPCLVAVTVTVIGKVLVSTMVVGTAVFVHVTTSEICVCGGAEVSVAVWVAVWVEFSVIVTSKCSVSMGTGLDTARVWVMTISLLGPS